mgnify:FL=1
MPHIEEPSPHSEEVEEIITDTPPWLLRWGLTVFFGVLVSMVICSAFIKMPDKVTGQLSIESSNRPEEIIPHREGKLIKLFIKENAKVDSGKLLGYIESNAKTEQVIQISQQIDLLQQQAISGELDALFNINLNVVEHLGELQGSFLLFSESLNNFRSFLSNGVYLQKKQMINQEINDLVLQKSRLNNQRRIYQQDFEIAEKEFQAHQKLLEGKVISSLEFKREESKYINKKIPLENVASSLLSNGITQNLKQQELKELDNQVRIERANFLAKINQFKSEIDNWKMEHLLIAKTSGTVVFNQFVNEGDWVAANKPLFYISSKDEGKYIGEMKIGQYALGKVFEGQTVVIRLKAFPYQEYGVLKGKISYLSNLNATKDTSYVARVTFDNGKQSTYQKELNLKNGLIADAEIITQHRSLLVKLFSSVVSLFKNE